MIHEEIKKYRELSEDNNPNTSIGRISSYLDGYNKGLEEAWKAARLLILAGGLSRDEIYKLFDTDWPVVLATYTAAEVVEKIGDPRC